MTSDWPKRLTILLALVLAGAGRAGAGSSGETTEAVRVRVRSDLARCVRPALESLAAGHGLSLTVEAGSGAPGSGIDILISSGADVTHLLEGGGADENDVVDIGHLPRPGAGTRTVFALLLKEVPHRAAAGRLLDLLRAAEVRAAIDRCLSGGSAEAKAQEEATASDVTTTGTASYATAVIDWWMPTCSLAYNGYNDPSQVLGAPDALKFGKDDYTGIMSLGQGGYVIVDMGRSVADHAGSEFRVYQTTSSEPVTLYAADSASGPFTLIGLQRECGTRIAHLLSGYCDFDLAEGGLRSARYLKIEDGEIYPCVAGSTITEGADIDAVEILSTP